VIRRQVNRILRKAFGWGLHPNWSNVLEQSPQWREALAASDRAPKILIATSTGGYAPGTVLESTLAVAMTLRGAQVHVLLCDKLLPACHQAIVRQFPVQTEFVNHGPSRVLCRTCFGPALKMYESLGLRVHRYSDFVTDAESTRARQLAASVPASEIGQFRIDDLAVGEHALAGTLRFFARGDLDGEPFGEAVLRRYFQASLLTTYATQRLLDCMGFDSACFHHGIYVPQGLIGEVARAKGVRVVNWNPTYRKQCFIFSHDDTYHHTLLSEPTALWETLAWNAGLEKQLLDYLKSRWYGTQDWIYFHEKPREELSAIAAELGVDFSKPCVGMLSNVIWDAQLHYRANAFPNMLDWVVRTIRYFSKRPDLQLIIRIHPAELRGGVPSRQQLAPEIHQAFPVLPRNVFVIPPDSHISTYAVMEVCNAAIIYGTKTGVELSSLGIPVIVAGEAWIRHKGISMDANTPEEYFALLDLLPLTSRLSEETVQRARKYAYHFFFRRMIPLPFMVEQAGDWPPYRLQIDSLADLEPGVSRGLDVICDGILNGAEFIYPAESIDSRSVL